MRKPPIPAELNPKHHHERPGEPPANHPERYEGDERAELEQLYEQEMEEREEDLVERRKEPLNNPGG